MGAYILRRLIYLIPVLLGVALLVFAIAKVTPGDPARLMLGQSATPERIATLHEQLHLDDPILVQYGRFIWNALHGDLGTSFRGQKPVLREVLLRFPNTLELTVAAILFAVVVGIPAGVLAVMNKGKAWDSLIMVSSLTGLSIPTFWLAIVLIIIFGVNLKWIPVSGGEGLKSLILPTLCLGIGPAAVLARLTRASVLEVYNEDYVRTARSKGLGERAVMIVHVLRNALIPVATYLGLLFADLLGGAVFIESVFARSGLGRFLVNAITARDFPQIQGGTLFAASVYVLVNLIVDLLYGAIDPRVTLTDEAK